MPGCPACDALMLSTTDGRCPSCGEAMARSGREAPFRLTIDRVEAIPGSGAIAHGRVASGRVDVGDTVELQGVEERLRAVVAGVMVGDKLLDTASHGQTAGVMLRGVSAGSLMVGQVLAAIQA